MYTHPIGFRGRAAGPAIGRRNRQHGDPGRGNRPSFSAAAYAIELNMAVSTSHWNSKSLHIMLEENTLFANSGACAVNGNGRPTPRRSIKRVG